MKAFVSLSFLLTFFVGRIFCDPLIPFTGFVVRPIDPTTNLLSGMTWTSDGLFVCDRGAGTLLLVHDNQSTDIILENLDTPVDVMEYNHEWLILQEETGTLIGVNQTTLQRRTIAEGFVHPTAFTIDDRNNAYIVEFDTGFLFKIDLKTGHVEQQQGMFDRPADILFVKPDRLFIADQVGADLNDGIVVETNMNGAPIHFARGVVDPTGLSLGPSGDIYVSTFSIPMMGPHEDRRKPQLNGGVMRIKDQHRPEEIVSGLMGPTSIVFDGKGNLIVLEEPTDSIYRYSLSGGEREPLLEGFAPIDQAARNNNGDTFVIEKKPPHQFKVQKKEESISIWDHPTEGMWDWIKMTVDGQGNVYLSDPMISKLLVFDESGNPINTYDNILPHFMMGISTGGILLFPTFGPSIDVHRVKPNLEVETFPIQINAAFSTGFTNSEDSLTLCLSNGEIQELKLSTNEKHSIVPANQLAYQSSAPDSRNNRAFWVLDSNNQILFWNENELIPAAQASEPGLLLSDKDGILFLSHSGKRFLIETEHTSLPNWLLY